MGCKILVDENIGIQITGAARNLLAFSNYNIEIDHILEKFSEGWDDENWLFEVKNEDYIILSSDRGKRYGGEKLHILCIELGIQHINYSGTIHNQPQFEKIRGLLTVIQDIIDIPNEDYLRYTISYTGGKKGFRLERKKVH